MAKQLKKREREKRKSKKQNDRNKILVLTVEGGLEWSSRGISAGLCIVQHIHKQSGKGVSSEDTDFAEVHNLFWLK